jgi:hypothetical protein
MLRRQEEAPVLNAFHCLWVSAAVASAAAGPAVAAPKVTPLSDFYGIRHASGGLWMFKWTRDDILARGADGKWAYVGTVEAAASPQGIAFLGAGSGLTANPMAISPDGRSIVFHHWPLHAPKQGSQRELGIYQHVHGEGLRLLLRESEVLFGSYSRWEKPVPAHVLPFRYRDDHAHGNMRWAITADGEKFPLALHEAAPLHWAAFEGRTEECSRLLNQGASIDAVTYWGFTSLDLAIIVGHEGTAIRLLESSSRAEASDMLLLQRAVQLGRLEVVQVLLERGVDPDARNEWGDTALHLAAAIRGDGSTGLTLFFHGVETSQSLLERNVTVPLIRLLLTRGADPTLRNRKGEAPLDVLHPQAPEEARSLLTGEAKP